MRVIHKGIRNFSSTPLCYRDGRVVPMDNTSRSWENVTCKKCLKYRKDKQKGSDGGNDVSKAKE